MMRMEIFLTFYSKTGSSLIDYILLPVTMFDCIKHFETGIFNHFSDHSPVSFSLPVLSHVIELPDNAGISQLKTFISGITKMYRLCMTHFVIIMIVYWTSVTILTSVKLVSIVVLIVFLIELMICCLIIAPILILIENAVKSYY